MNKLALSDRRLNDNDLLACKSNYLAVYGVPMPMDKHTVQVDKFLLKHERLKRIREQNLMVQQESK